MNYFQTNINKDTIVWPYVTPNRCNTVWRNKSASRRRRRCRRRRRRCRRYHHHHHHQLFIIKCK